MKKRKREGNMDIKSVGEYREWSEFIFISILFCVGFFVLYLSGINLTSLTIWQAKLVELLISGVQRHSLLEVIASTFSGIFIALFSFVLLCLGLSLLSVKKLNETRYLLIIPIILSGFLFHFSILFWFFAFGLFISCLCVIPLGDTYYFELKKWKIFRVGSNSVSKSLSILFLFIFLGSLISFYSNPTYKQIFLNETKESLTRLATAEVSGIQYIDNNTSKEYVDLMVERQMKQIRERYPGLNETQYAEIEEDIRKNIERQINNSENSTKVPVSDIVETAIKKSVIFKALSVWFPLIMGFTIWVALEFFKSILFSPISGVFSSFWFYTIGLDSDKLGCEEGNREPQGKEGKK